MKTATVDCFGILTITVTNDSPVQTNILTASPEGGGFTLVLYEYARHSSRTWPVLPSGILLKSGLSKPVVIVPGGTSIFTTDLQKIFGPLDRGDYELQVRDRVGMDLIPIVKFTL